VGAWHRFCATDSTSFGGESVLLDVRSRSRVGVNRALRPESTGSAPPPSSPTSRWHVKEASRCHAPRIVQQKDVIMNNETFVERIKICVYDVAIRIVKSNLKEVQGRSPRKSDLARSQWYNQLSDQDRAMVDEVIADSVRSAVFGMLMVIDGERPIRDGDEPDGACELRYRTEDGEESLLTGGNNPLGDIFLATVPLKE